MIRIGRSLRLQLFCFLFLLPGCRKDDQPVRDCVCSEQFATYTAFVKDRSGNLLDSLQATSTNLRTGKQYSFRQPWQGEPFLGHAGRYIVLTDEATKDLGIVPDTIVFKATRGGTIVAEGRYLFNTDECRCHINKVAGADTLTTL